MGGRRSFSLSSREGCHSFPVNPAFLHSFYGPPPLRSLIPCLSRASPRTRTSPLHLLSIIRDSLSRLQPRTADEPIRVPQGDQPICPHPWVWTQQQPISAGGTQDGWLRISYLCGRFLAGMIPPPLKLPIVGSLYLFTVFVVLCKVLGPVLTVG